MKLEPNMYVRTKDGIITKVNYIDDDTIFFDKDLYRNYGDSINFLGKDNLERIVKASYNIIDILEVGDYVNGQEIYYDEELNFLYVQSFDANGEFYQESITKQSFIDNIKSIVTHEQMEQMTYKVGE